MCWPRELCQKYQKIFVGNVSRASCRDHVLSCSDTASDTLRWVVSNTSKKLLSVAFKFKSFQSIFWEPKAGRTFLISLAPQQGKRSCSASCIRSLVYDSMMWIPFHPARLFYLYCIMYHIENHTYNIYLQVHINRLVFSSIYIHDIMG